MERRPETGDRRGYRQFCGLARALDVVGERWTLLVVRELLTGPKRFSDLLAALPGISTNLLATRLRTMQRDGLVRRERLQPPAPASVYVLTEDGRGLGDVVKRLAVWGLRLLDAPAPGDAFRPSWLAFYFDVVADRGRAAGVRDVYGFEVGGQAFHVVVDDGRIDVVEGRPPVRADVTVRSDVATFTAIGLGRTGVYEAAAAGALGIEGSPDAAARCLEILAPAARGA